MLICPDQVKAAAEAPITGAAIALPTGAGRVTSAVLGAARAVLAVVVATTTLGRLIVPEMCPLRREYPLALSLAFRSPKGDAPTVEA